MQRDLARAVLHIWNVYTIALDSCKDSSAAIRTLEELCFGDYEIMNLHQYTELDIRTGKVTI